MLKDTATVPLVDAGEEVGAVLRTQDGVKPVYVSAGHRIGLAHACRLTLALTPRYRLPETTRQAVARNAGRGPGQKVPNVAIFTVAKRLEAPTRAEGFDELFRVTLTEDRTFSVAVIP